ncbi:MAG TPA: hypothetical protein VKU85_01850 [bacterium]|nr:hypothetical protein [bacterium]
MTRPAHGIEHAAALVILGVVAAALLHWVPFSSTHMLTDDFLAGPGQSDAYTFLWGNWWAHTALTHGQSPYFCDWVLPPTGADLRFHTVPWVTAFVTWPLSFFLPPVLLYNLSILGLIVGGAFVMYLGLRITFEARFAVAVVFGALFGMCPYFLFKVHAHPNLVGSLFWGSAIAVLLHAAVHRSSAWKHVLLFGLAFWLCFWSSLVEWAMLVVVVGGVTAAAVAFAGFRPAWRWLVPILVGAPSLLLFRAASGLEVPLFPPVPASRWLQFPVLSLFSDGGWPGMLPEYGGLGIPWGIGALGIFGLVREPDRRLRFLLGWIVAGLVVLTLDPFHVVSRAFRAAPLGESMRVFARFYPFALFFLVIAAARAVEGVLRKGGRRLATAFVVVAILVAAAETVPADVHPERVVSLDLPAPVRASLDESRWVMVFPAAARTYPRRREAYQVELGMRFVQMGHLTREDPEARRVRARTYPLFFGETPQGGITPADLRAELTRMSVGYILLDRPELLPQFPFPARVLHRTENEILLELAPD